MEQMIARYYSEPNGGTQLYVGQESIIPGISAWPLPHDAPYTPQINHLMMAVVEAGLYEKWSRDMLVEAQRQSRVRQREYLEKNQQLEALQNVQEDLPSTDSRLSALNLVHMQGPLMLLLLGLSIGGLVFTVEITASYFNLNV
ncbi:uncharacterized protein LOC121874011 [Homarus americanus]|uniref:Putative variant ionotropic glutamate receptor-like 7 n=1 Tax=Homarus americanus TaxID=6706 RepID=A0A8J5JQD6_HOMAM|nr:uncharacterized protein LOC121874011 [Homarus americanus]KAG7162417.1 putative variant ionotropic glutamate receptor-like 7 [Homarus americanus]